MNTSRYTKLLDWISVIILLYEMALKQSMVDEKLDEKKAMELKKIYNYYLDKRSEIMNSTQFKVEQVIGRIVDEDRLSPKQKTGINNFRPKYCKHKHKYHF